MPLLRAWRRLLLLLLRGARSSATSALTRACALWPCVHGRVCGYACVCVCVQLFIYCTEPFRIPTAGRIDVACFDKTGTLTSDAFEVRGVTQLGGAGVAKSGGGGGGAASLCSVQALSTEAVYVLGACHSLVLVGDRMEGDPMERAAVEWVEWAMQRDGTCRPTGAPRGGGRREPNEKLRVVRKWPFEAAARRMSVVVCLDHRGTRDLWCAAPSCCAVGLAFMGVRDAGCSPRGRPRSLSRS